MYRVRSTVAMLTGAAAMAGLTAGCPDSSKPPPASAPMVSSPQVSSQPASMPASVASAAASGYGSSGTDYGSGLTAPDRASVVVLPYPTAVPSPGSTGNTAVSIPTYTPPPLGQAEQAPPLPPHEGGFQNPLTYLPRAPSNLSPENARGIELPVSYWNQPAIKKMLKDGSIKLPKGLVMSPLKDDEFGFEVTATPEYRGSRTEPTTPPGESATKAQVAGK